MTIGVIIIKNKMIMLTALLAVMLSMTGIAAACDDRNNPDCTFEPKIGTAVVDGILSPGEWNLPFYWITQGDKFGDITNSNGKLRGTAYVKYCCADNILFVMVKLKPGYFINPTNLDKNWAGFGNDKEVKGTDGLPNFAPMTEPKLDRHGNQIYDHGIPVTRIVGFEASFQLLPEDNLKDFSIHVNGYEVLPETDTQEEQRFSDEDCEVSLILNCPIDNGETNDIPEFPTVALPIAAVIGMVFLFQNRKKKE